MTAAEADARELAAALAAYSEERKLAVVTISALHVKQGPAWLKRDSSGKRRAEPVDDWQWEVMA